MSLVFSLAIHPELWPRVMEIKSPKTRSEYISLYNIIGGHGRVGLLLWKVISYKYILYLQGQGDQGYCHLLHSGLWLSNDFEFLSHDRDEDDVFLKKLNQLQDRPRPGVYNMLF